jgi:hypothetical protein
MDDASWCGLTADVLRLVHKRLPCLVDRRRMARVCRTWRAAVLAGCATHAFRPPLPADARTARYFGAYDGGWVFVAFGQILDYALLSLRNGTRFHFPDTGTDMVAATLSSPPDVRSTRSCTIHA